jgi:acyl-CoA oxidase
MSIYDAGFAMRNGVHTILFGPTVMNQGTPEQVAKYENDIKNKKILGCFAMTELGNGSFIQNFETTATYDKSTQEFVVNSPTVSSTKWWIGMAAQTATHSVVFARLLIGKEDHGRVVIDCYLPIY